MPTPAASPPLNGGSGPAGSSPELRIRRYLEGHGGEVDATVEHLLTTFGVAEDDPGGRDRITTALLRAGVGIDRPLPFLSADEGVHLFAADPRYLRPPHVGNGGASAATDMPAVNGHAEPPRRGMTVTLGRKAKATVFVLLALLLLAGASFGAYRYGESTRLSDSEVAERVTKAVDVRSDQAEIDEALAVKSARHDQRVADRKKWKKRMDEAVASAREEGYSSGSSAGWASGHETGVQDGLDQGSDELTCSDDSDVPLPACTWW